MSTDRRHYEAAARVLTRDELDVWHAKHLFGYGRRAGSIRLGISEEAWRYRLSTAERKIDAALDQEEPAA